MMTSSRPPVYPGYSAKRMSASEFFEIYEPAMATWDLGAASALRDALANPDPASRVAIASRLLDDGADATYSGEGGVNLVHILFHHRAHDIMAEAPLLQRLLDGGADINQYGRKFGPPLMVLISNTGLREAALDPFYDVLFSRGDLDFEVRADAAKPPRSMRQRIEMAEQRRPGLLHRMRRYDVEGPAPRP